MNRAFAAQTKAFSRRDKVAKEIGTGSAVRHTRIKVERDRDRAAFRPQCRAEEHGRDAADNYIGRPRSGNCSLISANRHTDAGDLDKPAARRPAGL